MTCSIRVCVCWGSFPSFKMGETVNWPQRESPRLKVLGHTPTLSHKMMYLSADPRRRAQQNLSLERSEKGPPSGPSSRVCPKTVFRRQSRPTFCVFAVKTCTKTHTRTLTSFRTSYVCHFRRVFRAKTNPCLFVWGVFAFRPKNTYENTHLPPHRFRHQVGVSFQTCFQGESEHC